MGSSGAGKSTLLNILSNRVNVKRRDTLTGEILLNDIYPLGKETFGRNAAYVMQDDVVFDFFTPREALRFAARLKLKSKKEY